MKQIKLDSLLADLETSRHKLSRLEDEIKDLSDQAISSSQLKEKSQALESGRIIKLEADLQEKEELLSDALEKYQFSATKIEKMDLKYRDKQKTKKCMKRCCQQY